MSRLFAACAALAVLAGPVMAAPPAEPETVILPVPVVSAVMNHLAAEPWKDVAGLLGPLQACIAVQVQTAAPVTGDCPAVRAALAAKTPAVTAPAATTPTPP